MEDARDAPFSTFSCWLAQSIISLANYVNSELYFPSIWMIESRELEGCWLDFAGSIGGNSVLTCLIILG